MKRAASILGLALLMAGCVTPTLIEAKRTSIGGTYTVEPQVRWTSFPAGDMTELWTVDGAGLEAIRFVKGAGDGAIVLQGMIAGVPAEKRPKFRVSMSPSEIMELVVDSYSLIGAQKIETTGLRPVKFGAADGFRFEMTFVWKNGLEAQALVAGAVVKNRLYLIVYSGTRVHYFPKHKDDVERILSSIQLQ